MFTRTSDWLLAAAAGSLLVASASAQTVVVNGETVRTLLLPPSPTCFPRYIFLGTTNHRHVCHLVFLFVLFSSLLCGFYIVAIVRVLLC